MFWKVYLLLYLASMTKEIKTDSKMKNGPFATLPLPSSSPKEDLETISRNKLTALFDTALFEIRHETQRDKGIDLIIEIKQNNQYTNFRFAIQLKATASKPNKSGFISCPVKVSNLNYLMNYGMPAYYILYEQSTDQFYLEHKNDAYQNLLKKHHKKLPKTFTVKFSKVLTPELIREVYQKTLENGELFRRLNSHLKFQTGESKSIKGIVIDEDNEVYNVGQNIAFIEQCGLLLLNNAEFDRIIEIEQRTYPRTEASPMFNFVCGIAYFQRVNLFRAMDFLKAAQKSNKFTPDIQAHLSYTLLNAKYLLGMMSKHDFQDELSTLMDAKEMGSFLQIEKAYNDFVKRVEKDDSKGIQTLYDKIKEIILEEKDNYRLRVMAYGKILDAESKILANDIVERSFLICGRVKDIFKTKTFKQWGILCEGFEKRVDSLIKFAVTQKNFQGASNIWSCKIEWDYKKIYQKHLIQNWKRVNFDLDKELDKNEMDILLKCLTDLDKIGATYEALQDKENLVLSLFHKYELLHFARLKEDATIVAKRVAEMIKANDFNGLMSRYDELINGGTSHEKFINSFTIHVNRVRSSVKASGIEDEYIYGSIPEEFLEYMERDIKWSIKNFYEFDFS
jgi:hypothetical protein